MTNDTFIKLTATNGKAIYLRASAVNMVTEDKDGTVICYGNDMCYQVKECIIDVLGLLGDYHTLSEPTTEYIEEYTRRAKNPTYFVTGYGTASSNPFPMVDASRGKTT